MKIISLALVFLMLVSCATFRTEPVLRGDKIFGKGRLYLYEKENVDYLDFIFSYGENKLKIEGISIFGNPIFQIFISEKTYMVIPKSNSYWEGSLTELTKFFLRKEISEKEILKIFAGEKDNSIEIKEFFKNSNFPKEIYWNGEGMEGRLKIKWVKRSDRMNLDLDIPSSFRKVSLEEIEI
jgi:hypothetical protein